MILLVNVDPEYKTHCYVHIDKTNSQEVEGKNPNQSNLPV